MRARARFTPEPVSQCRQTGKFISERKTEYLPSPHPNQSIYRPPPPEQRSGNNDLLIIKKNIRIFKVFYYNSNNI